ARTAEKAMTALSRWRDMKMREGKILDKRPFLASECSSVPDAEKWRKQIIREIARKVSQIQNPGLGEFRTRDLNDEINKLLREKRHWEIRIKELGGPDHFASSNISIRILNREGKEIPANPGYKYFGAAKDLPGVRELLSEQIVQPSNRKSKGEILRNIDCHYYGYLDEDDGLLLPQEKIAQQIARKALVQKWEEDRKTLKNQQQESTPSSHTLENFTENEEIDEYEDYICDTQIYVPTQKDMELALLNKRKLELMSKYSLQTRGDMDDE
ncbi:unnamed protein product, partial [Gordionus sp. m RMFG-2023]